MEMLRTVAPDLLDSAAPDHEADRTPSHRHAIAARSWSTLAPPRATPAEATTISASPGVIAVEPPRRHARSKLVLASLGACGLAGLVTFALVRSVQGPPPRTTAAEPTSLAPPQADAASSPPGDGPAGPVSEDASAAPAVMGPDTAQSLSSAVAPSAQELQRAPPPRTVPRPRPPVAPARPLQPGQTSPLPRRARADEPRGARPPAAEDDTFDPDSPTGR
jgi:hypothetical protein